MTFDATERSVASAQPVELYKFTGTDNTYRMTSAEADITNTEGTYTATPVKRNKLQTGTQEETNLALELELPYAHPMVTEYVFQDSPPSLELELFRAHRNDLNDTLQLWKGEVISWSIVGRVAKLKIPSLFSYALDQPVPPIKYQGPCNHVFGDARCGIDLTAAPNEQISTISIVSANSITIADASTFADGTCAGGEMIVGGERRLIITNVGSVFTVATPFASAAATNAVTIHWGCDHSFAGAGGCVLRHNNGINFGGFPLVPIRNPFAGRL